MIPLHLPSHWSVGHGVASVAELATRGAAWGLPSMALTDLENLSGAVEFHHRCRVRGIRPILGVELRRGFISNGRRSRFGSRAGRLVLLARDASGHRSLCRIVSRRRTEGFHRPAGDPVPDLLAYPDGVFALTDDPAAAARLLGGGFPSRFARLLLVRPARSAEGERRVLDAARRLGLPLVADLDAFGLRTVDEELLRLQRAIRFGFPFRSAAMPGYRRLLDPERARSLFADLPQAVAETERVAEACAGDVLPSGAGSPIVDLTRGEAPAARLRAITRAALERARHGGSMPSFAYDERLERELSAIEALDLANWFLALDEIAAFARRRGIKILGRGSAVGSLVVHLIGLGPVDPVEQGLLFERFLRPRRPSPFDVDLDLPSRRREEVMEWVLARWGPYAAAVGAHQRFGPRSAKRDSEAAMGPGVWLDDRIRERLIGSPRGLSVHPGGVILGGTPIRDVVPLEMAPKGIPVTQLDARSLDALGIVKLDFLGNTCLDEIDRAIELVGRRSREWPQAADVSIPGDDPATLGRLAAGDTIGISQIETPATRASLRRRPIRSIDDLTAALASVRPGPSSEGGPLFEEDVMRILSLGGAWTMEEADGWRAEIVATDGNAEGLAALGRRYVGAAGVRGVPRDRATNAWLAAAPFASYAFSKAHASSYALLAYRAAFLRTHYPLEWGCAVLDAHGGAYLERTIAAEVARWGIPVRPPAINESGPRTSIRDGSGLLLGLDGIRGVSVSTKAALLTERKAGGPYCTLADLLRRVRPRLREIEALILSGACDSLAPLSPEEYPFVHEAVLASLRSGGDTESIRCPSWRIDTEAGLRGEGVRRYQALVRARNELRYLGVTPSGHPLGILRARSAADGCRTIADVLRDERDGEVSIAALPAATRQVDTARGSMRFVTWEDETGLLDSRIAPAAHARLAARFRADGAFRVSGRMRSCDAVRRLEVDALQPLESRGVGR